MIRQSLSAQRDRVKLRARQARANLDARHDRCLGRSQQGSDGRRFSQAPASFNVGVMQAFVLYHPGGVSYLPCEVTTPFQVRNRVFLLMANAIPVSPAERALRSVEEVVLILLR